MLFYVQINITLLYVMNL